MDDSDSSPYDNYAILIFDFYDIIVLLHKVFYIGWVIGPSLAISDWGVAEENNTQSVPLLTSPIRQYYDIVYLYKGNFNTIVYDNVLIKFFFQLLIIFTFFYRESYGEHSLFFLFINMFFRSLFLHFQTYVFHICFHIRKTCVYHIFKNIWTYEKHYIAFFPCVLRVQYI